MSIPLLIATNNPHKLAEFRRMLGQSLFQVLSPAEIDLSLAVPETGDTFAENARQKAEGFCRAASMMTLADDSGLVVDALNGEPGVYSARYGGEGLSDEDRVQLVLRRMRGVPYERRSARFVAAVALAHPESRTVVFEGSVEGLLTTEPKGEHGFGYDPIFYYPPFASTLAEAEPGMKDQVSHRSRALRQAVRFLRTQAGPGYTQLAVSP